MRFWNLTDKRYVKDNFHVKRYALSKCKEVKDGGKVRDLLTHAKAVLAMDLTQPKRRLELRFTNSEGKRIVASTSVRTVRAYCAAPSADSDTRARRTFAKLFELTKITASTKKRDALYDELAKILDQPWEEALLANSTSIAHRKV